MRLRGIEMQGFKSFPERTRLTFNDGITAVVGPNGSGKSNISDAVKWVFGEQSVKSLRGTKMEDVIFNGTQNRKAQGYAWVSLIIDNSDRELDIDNDEVIITRKLYRSGESEYRINNNQVRLKDIHELFMDTGLGRDGYSIIEQGKIAEIVSAKSTQRREIFEEAAGISRYRYRKEEAERRLEKAEENMVRLRDIMVELEDRVGPLKTQSEKAKKFLLFSEEKKSLEISLWLETLDKLKGQIKEQEDKILLCRSDRQNAGTALESLEAQMEELSRTVQDCNIYIENKRAEIKELEEAASGAQTGIAVKENDILHNRATIADLQNQLESSSSSSSDFAGQIAEREAQLARQSQALEQCRTECEAVREELEQTRKEGETLAATLEALTQQREQLQGGINRSRISSETSATLVEETVFRMENLRTQTKDKDLRLGDLRRELAESDAFCRELESTIEGLRNTMGGYEYKIQGRREKLENLESQQYTLEKSIGEKLQRAQVLSDLEKSMEGFSGSVKHIMKQASSGALGGIIGPVSGLIGVEKKYATAIEIALGAAMQNIVVEDEAVAKRAIASLRDARAGRSTFLPLSTIRGNILRESGLDSHHGFVGIAAGLVECDQRYRGIIDYSLGRVVIAEDIDAAIEIGRAFNHRFRIVTLDGQVVNAGGSLTGGYVGKNASILSRKNEIETLRAQARELTEKNKALETEIEAARREMSEMTALMDGVDAEARTANEDLIAAGAESRRLKMAVEEAETTAEQALKEFDALTARVEELKNQGLTSGQLEEKLTAELATVNQQLEATTRHQEELAQKTTQQNLRYSQEQVRLAEAQKDHQVLSAAVDSLKEQQAGNNSQLEALQERIAQLEELNAATALEIEELSSAATGNRDAVEQRTAAIEAKLKEREQAEEKNTQLRQEEKQLNAQNEGISGELARLEERLVSLNGENDTISAKLWDEYELSRSEAVAHAIPLEDSAAASRRLTELRGKIRNLGSVNVAAIEEYDEVSQRYEFYKAQIDDVEKSKQELGRLISDLSGQMSSIFLDKFQAINKYFGLIFVEMFGGGKGELRLTDPEDPLNTGIDIMVQPSGKMVGISLLSGGEKALVAICIYFAILRVNPSPFVLIDEIEAALDDVNVTRFAGYLRKMTDKTQFIAITHRRGTMEEADVLYGVTMEEKGVSKLLRLNVSEMEQTLKLNLA